MAETTTEDMLARLRGRMAVTVSTVGSVGGFHCSRADILALLDAYEAEHARAERLAAENERLLPMVRSYLVSMSYQGWYCRSCGVEAPISDDIESLCHVAPCPLAGDAPGRGEEG